MFGPKSERLLKSEMIGGKIKSNQNKPQSGWWKVATGKSQSRTSGGSFNNRHYTSVSSPEFIFFVTNENFKI